MPRTPIDLTNCDREPIHIPGAIQPHGVMLGVRDLDGVVVQASANARQRLQQKSIVGESLSSVLSPEAADAVIRAVGASGLRTTTGISIPAGDFDVTVHSSDGLIVVELETTTGQDWFTPEALRDVTRETLGHVERATTLYGLAGEIAAQMRRLTGFDRVWVYRFHEDWHGEIIGESMTDGIEPWLGLHYPASDIPAQARALFLKNWLRMIPDVGFVPVPIEPTDNPVTGLPLDLGNSVLRSVSPIHIQYLKNMGVTASLVISLIHQGRLWGLISGHHYSGPKKVPLAMRTMCEFLAQALSLQVGMTEQLEDRDRELGVRAVERTLRQRLSESQSYARTLTHGTPTMLDLATASGAAVCDEDGCECIGDTPSREDLTGLVRWLRQSGHDVFQTEMLSRHYAPSVAWSKFASGLLAVALSPKRPNYLLWFRPELKQTIRWAGDPNKPVTEDSNGGVRLSPRGSFALWEEERRGISAPWDDGAVEAAMDLRRTVLDIFLARAEELAALNTELEATNQHMAEAAVELETQTEELLRQREERDELLDAERRAREEAERANRAKADFLAMMSHELRTPLNAIGGYAQMLEMGVRGAVNEKQRVDLQRIQQSQRHLLGLINNILNFAKVEAGQVPINLSVFSLEDLFVEMETLVAPQIASKELEFTVERPGAGAMVHADQEKVRQILVNLVSNAIKFTGRGGSIRLCTRREKGKLLVDVADSGSGIAADRLDSIFEPFVQVDSLSGPRQEGIGLGLAISRELARTMGGDLTAVSEPGVGSTFTVAIPAAPAAG